MNLENLRAEIDRVDDALAPLLAQRMELASQVAQAKMANDEQVHHPAREQEVLQRICKNAPDHLQQPLNMIYRTVFLANRARQHRLMVEAEETSPLRQQLTAALERGQGNPWPVGASVACQGVEGAFSHIAARNMFDQPRILSMHEFEMVFRAVEQGLCNFGVLPIENTTYGSVMRVYDLLRKHKCSIVRAIRLPIRHCLLSNERFLKDITEIWSHEQALRQCDSFIQKLGDRVTTHVCDNTAIAAKRAAQEDKPGVAVISSEECADLYGLNVLKQEIQDRSDNQTRFICITKQAMIPPCANKSSVLISLPHHAGTLAEILQLLASMEINLTKLTNLPVLGNALDAVFYLDLECDATSPNYPIMIEKLARHCETLDVLGSYEEITTPCNERTEPCSLA
ncbi:MAG: chorismate mutase [Oscillospiraceae bacterium]|nr:chorismate mutase [Oscillospiraceae bacterium]